VLQNDKCNVLPTICFEMSRNLNTRSVCESLHSLCATGVSSGLAMRVTLIPVSRGSLEMYLSYFIFVPQYVIVVGSRGPHSGEPLQGANQETSSRVPAPGELI
jgi:hypothetical protein